MRTLRVGLSLSLMLALSAGAAHADRPDGWITTKVKWQLLASDDIRGTAVNVDTTDRRVTLHGRVASAEQRDLATRLAQSVEGVREVRNLLVVAPFEAAPDTEARRAARRNDRELKDRVSAALAADRALAGEDVRVKSVNDGVVVLAGRTTSTNDHQRALRVAYGIPGVERVASEIQSPDPAAELALWRAGVIDQAETDPSAWDPLLTTRVKLKLLAADEVPGLDVNVDTLDGVVTLFGIVPTDEASRIAQAEAESVDGVVRVINEIQVVPDPNRESIRAADERAEDRVEERLRNEPGLRRHDIDVEVRDGVARLTGSVGTEPERLSALVVARTTEGISKVVDDVQVAPPARQAARVPGE